MWWTMRADRTQSDLLWTVAPAAAGGVRARQVTAATARGAALAWVADRTTTDGHQLSVRVAAPGKRQVLVQLTRRFGSWKAEVKATVPEPALVETETDGSAP